MSAVVSGHTLDLDGFVSLSQAARIAQVSAPTVRRWHAAGRVRGVETPLGTLYARADVVAAARARAARGATEGSEEVWQ